MSRNDKLPKGIRISKGKYQAYVRVDGVLSTKTFPLDTNLSTMHRWREAERVHLREGAPKSSQTGPTFAADVVTYTRLIGHMPTRKDRLYHLAQWTELFGARSRDSITPLEIRHALERWRGTGSAVGGPLSPATLNLRRTALLALFTTLDGKHMPNPVKGVPPYREVETPLVLPSHDEAQRAIAAVRNPTYTKKAKHRVPVSQARLWVLYWTGWPSSTLKRVRPEHIHEARGTVVVHGRLKGGGTKPRELLVKPQAMEALKALRKIQGGLGPFSGSSLNHSLKSGCRRANVRPFSVYTLRHLFGTTLAQHSSDERGISELMGHADPRQTRRYTRHAASERARAVLAETMSAFPAEQLGATSASGALRPVPASKTTKRRSSGIISTPEEGR